MAPGRLDTVVPGGQPQGGKATIRTVITAFVATIACAIWLGYSVAALLLELPQARIGTIDLIELVTVTVPVILIAMIARGSVERTRMKDRFEEQRNETAVLKKQVNELLRMGMRWGRAGNSTVAGAGYPAGPNIQPPTTVQQQQDKPGAADPPRPQEVESTDGEEGSTWLAELKMPASRFLLAMNLAEDSSDRDGIRAVNSAMQSDRCASIIDMALNILQMLAECDLYLEDLPSEIVPDRAWRKFAADFAASPIPCLTTDGAEREIAIVRDLAENRLAFRKIAKQFRFETAALLRAVIPLLNDQEIGELVESRIMRTLVLLEHAE